MQCVKNSAEEVAEVTYIGSNSNKNACFCKEKSVVKYWIRNLEEFSPCIIWLQNLKIGKADKQQKDLKCGATGSVENKMGGKVTNEWFREIIGRNKMFVES